MGFLFYADSDASAWGDSGGLRKGLGAASSGKFLAGAAFF